MDVTKLVVIVLTLIAFGFLVMIELNSRRNTRALKALSSQPEPAPVDDVPRKRKK